jgi:hypothetical protein
MRKQIVKLDNSQIIQILDRLHKDAYDILQQELEVKLMNQIGEDLWLDAWESGRWKIDMRLTAIIPTEEKV